MKERREEEEVGTCPSFAVEKSATGTGGRLLLSLAPGDWTELGRGSAGRPGGGGQLLEVTLFR